MRSQKRNPIDNTDISAKMRQKGEEIETVEAERSRVNQDVKKLEQNLKRLGEELAQEVGVVWVAVHVAYALCWCVCVCSEGQCLPTSSGVKISL